LDLTFFVMQIVKAYQAKLGPCVDVKISPPKSYKSNDISKPAFHAGFALPPEESGKR
jgi:hypothetical protein